MSAITPILEGLVDASKPVPVRTLVGLTGLDADERREFREAWRDVDVERRRQVILDLIDLIEDNVELDFDAVFLAVLDDPDPEVRISAMHGLWEYEERDLIGPLINLMDNDESEEVRAAAATALGRYVLLAEFDRISRRDADRVIGALRSAFGMQTNPVTVRARALEAVGAHSEPWVSGVIRSALNGDEPRLVLSAVHAMGRSAEPDWLPQILDYAESPDAEMRYEVALAAGSIGEESALSGILPLIEDEDQEVQEAAIDALGKIGGSRAKAILKGLADNEDTRVREAAASALAEADLTDDSFLPGV